MRRSNSNLHARAAGHRRNPRASEFFDSAILVNGKQFPYLDVKPRKYRFRVINASNSWHCHILEHEDNEMMRPYNVVSAS